MSYSAICQTLSSLAEEEGIEPPLTVLETAALPLYYSSIFWAFLTAEVDYNTLLSDYASPIFLQNVTNYFALCFYISSVLNCDFYNSANKAGNPSKTYSNVALSLSHNVQFLHFLKKAFQ